MRFPGRLLLAGVFALLFMGACSREGRPLEYVFDKPLTVPPGSSLEISYAIRGGDGDTGAVGFILEPGVFSWELPGDLLFLGIEGLPSPVRYAVPLAGGETLEKIQIRREDPEGEKRGRKQTALPELTILGARIVERWFGFSLKEAAFTPFVYYRPSLLGDGRGDIVIDPPEQFRRRVNSDLTVEASGGIVAEVPAKVPAAGGSLRFEADPLLTGLFVPGELFPFGPFPFSVSGGGFREVRLVPALSSSQADLLPLDPGLILSWPEEALREKGYAVFRWDAFPEVLVFDTADYAVQDRLFKRLAFFVEKRGFRGRLAPDAEIAGLHGWNAHDYRAESLAAFFRAAEESDFPLLAEELELKALLLGVGIIARPAGGIVPGRGAVVSISRESETYLRYRFMVHEGFHGIYFVDKDFRDFSRRRWEALSDPARRFILSYFDFQAYDIGDADLVINEFMAHLLQQPASQAAAYFGDALPNRMITRSPRRAADLPGEGRTRRGGTKYWPALEQAFAAEAEAFSGYAEQRWGLAAGRVWKVNVSIRGN
jgi:hypothetical protein